MFPKNKSQFYNKKCNKNLLNKSIVYGVLELVISLSNQQICSVIGPTWVCPTVADWGL